MKETIKLNLRLFDEGTMTTLTGSLSDEMKTYYEKRLIDNAEPNLVHDQFGDKYPIPKGGGKQIEFRKYSPLPKALTSLTEGVTPPSNRLSVSNITASVAQYGDWIQLSDMLELTAIDRNVEQATKLLGGSAGRTLDTITREILCGGTNRLFAGHDVEGVYTRPSTRAGVTAKDIVTPDLVFEAAAELKAMNAQPIDDCYVAIVHPYVAYDLMTSPQWMDVHKYAEPQNIYQGELGKIGQVRFVESIEAKVVGPADILPGVPRLTVKTAATVATTTLTIKEAVSEDVATAFNATSGVDVYIAGTTNKITAVSAGSAGNATITVTSTTAAADAMICGRSAGSDGSAVFCTLVLGANAYGVTEIEGGGLQHIVKQLGYGDDPLNQRSSVGWKATKAAERLVEAYMIRIESGSAFSGKAVSN